MKGWILSVWMAGSAFAGQASGESPESPVGVEAPAPGLQVAPSERMGEMLSRLAALHPDHATLVTYGKSAGGRPLMALRVTVLPGEVSGSLLAVVADLRAPHAAVEQQMSMLENDLRALVLQDEAGGDGGVPDGMAPLQDRLWILAPDPDRVDGKATPERAWPEGDFPAGWDPWSREVRSGPYPYSTPEARALGKLLVAQSALAHLVIAGEAEPCEVAQPGSLQRFATEDLNVAVEHSGGQLARVLERLDAQRPRIAVQTGERRALGNGRWLVEVVASNLGGTALQAPGPIPSFELDGARLVALAAAGEDGVFQVVDAHNALDGIQPEGDRLLRVVLEVGGSERPLVVLSGLRWKTARCALDLAALQPK